MDTQLWPHVQGSLFQHPYESIFLSKHTCSYQSVGFLYHAAPTLPICVFANTFCIRTNFIHLPTHSNLQNVPGPRIWGQPPGFGVTEDWARPRIWLRRWRFPSDLTRSKIWFRRWRFPSVTAGTVTTATKSSTWPNREGTVTARTKSSTSVYVHAKTFLHKNKIQMNKQIIKQYVKNSKNTNIMMNFAFEIRRESNPRGANLSNLIRSSTLTTRPTVYIRLVPKVPITCDGNLRYQSYIHGRPSG